MNEYNGRPITKRTVNFGVGGVFTRDDGFPELPPRSRVTATVTFDFTKVAHKFLANGGVDEALILTMDTSSFQVRSVEEPPPEPEQPELGEAEGDDGP